MKWEIPFWESLFFCALLVSEMKSNALDAKIIIR